MTPRDPSTPDVVIEAMRDTRDDLLQQRREARDLITARRKDLEDAQRLREEVEDKIGALYEWAAKNDPDSLSGFPPPMRLTADELTDDEKRILMQPELSKIRLLPSDWDKSQAAPTRTETAFIVAKNRMTVPEGYGTSAYAAAAGCYLLHADAYRDPGDAPPEWPMKPEHWTPSTARDDLIQGGALAMIALESFDEKRKSRTQGSTTGE